PLRPPSLAPAQRSALLSEIHRLTSSPTLRSAASIYQVYTDLYLSSPHSHIFSSSELSAIIATLYQSRKKLRNRDQLNSVVSELKEIDAGYPGLGLKILASSRSARRVTNDQLQVSLRQLSRRPKPDRRSINHFLYLAALVPNDKLYRVWYDRYLELGYALDSYTILSHLILLSKTDRIEAMLMLLLNEIRKRSLPDSDLVILVNFVMGVCAKIQKWELVHILYARLSADPDPRDIFPPTADDTSPLLASFTSLPPSTLRPSRQTYLLLIQSLAFHGHLFSALTILQHLLQHHQPSIHEYLSLFAGFARFGQTKWQGSDLFPRLRSVTATSSSMLSIWSDIQPEPEPASISEWTSDVLFDLFASFLKVPRGESDIAPTALQTWRILAAFNRVSDGDVGVIRWAWEGLEEKFAGGEWVGWE
ncbi:hypothetical protein P7C73_g6869, partial [Tremellales sp. Uapishka_1]